MPTLKQKTLAAVAWNGIQNYGTLCVSFTSNLVLIRLLTPADFGTAGILSILVAFANTVIDGGFNSALIQKKRLVSEDADTVFIWNLIFSIVLLFVLVISAHTIENYFMIPGLAQLLRVGSILLIINSLGSVQTALLTKELNFKSLAIRRLVGATIGAIVGIIMAYNGWGVWSIVYRDIIGGAIGCILLWTLSSWRPHLRFSRTSFRALFKFGLFIFISNILYTIYQNIQGFIIGKAYSATELGYYSQAKKLQEIPISGTSSVITSVMFPVFASVSDNREYHRQLVRKNMRIISFVFSPIILFLICIANPLIEFLFTDKWQASIPLFQILCIYGLFFPLNASNTEIFKAIGRSDVYFILQTSKQITCILIILCFIPFGLMTLMWGMALTGIVSYGFNICFTQKYFGYDWRSQLIDICPSVLISACMSAIVFVILHFIDQHISNFPTILICLLIFAAGYLSISIIFNRKPLMEFKTLIKKH